MADFPHSAFHGAFVNDDFHGRDAIWTPAVGQSKSFRVTFVLGVESINLGGDIVPQGVIAQAGVPSADVVGIKQGEPLVIDEVTYRVLRIHPDETGWTTLFLGKGI